MPRAPRRRRRAYARSLEPMARILVGTTGGLVEIGGEHRHAGLDRVEEAPDLGVVACWHFDLEDYEPALAQAAE